MFVTEVIPLRRGIAVDTLSYFGSESYAVGSLIEVPLRNAQVPGLVVGTTEVSAAKTALRAATFSLRKLPAQTDVQSLSSAIIKTAEEFARLYATHMGSVLYSLLPPEIQSGEARLPHTHMVPPGEIPVPSVFEATREERFLTYRSLVRETFAHAGSVLIVVPTSAEAAYAHEVLAHGITDRVIMLASSEGKKNIRAAYDALEDFSRSKLIIATPSYALIERHDVTHIIVEESRSPHYKERVRPYLDYRDVLRIYAKHTGRTLMYADILVRAEEEYERRRDIFQTYGETPKRIALQGTLEVVKRAAKSEPSRAFSNFEPALLERLKEVKKKKEHFFIFSARRGLAPIVACGDCGHLFRSEESGAPYSLVRTMKNGTEERWFISHTSGERVRALDTCPVCSSWRLRERGIGIQQVHDELRSLFPSTPVFLFDHTTATTHKKARFLADSFYGTKGAIMLGTTMALPYLTRPLDGALIVSMDALLTNPTWRLEEENLALMLRLRENTTGTVYLQMQATEHDLIDYAKRGEVERFYTDELALRSSFQYPPFSTFIHLTWQAPPEAAKKIGALVTELLTPFDISIYQSPLTPKGNIIEHGLIRIPRGEWPKAPLVLALKELPPSIRIVINPERII